MKLHGIRYKTGINYPGHLQNPIYSGEAGSHYTKRNYRNSLLEVPFFQCSISVVNGQVWTLPGSAPFTRFLKGNEKTIFFSSFSHTFIWQHLCTIEFYFICARLCLLVVWGLSMAKQRTGCISTVEPGRKKDNSKKLLCKHHPGSNYLCFCI